MAWKVKYLGHVTLWVGFLVAAFASVSRLETVAGETDKWYVVPWPMYLAGMTLAIIGVFILRRTRKFHGDLQVGGDQSGYRPSAVVDELVRQLEKILQSIDDGDVYEVRHQIDAQIASLLAEFAHNRHWWIRRYGLKVFAEVMSSFALAERFVNRAWCASADGYLDEVRRSLTTAITELRKVQRVIHPLMGME